ncbi:MAG: hypothetical protein EB059_08030 [Alphaproteobacteria bacterium]|nr:hypothetical protein [Alphaproteobacteria bacterium]
MAIIHTSSRDADSATSLKSLQPAPVASALDKMLSHYHELAEIPTDDSEEDKYRPHTYISER